MKNDLATLVNLKAGKPRLLSALELPGDTTKGELVVAYNIEFIFDYSIPNYWACIAQKVSGAAGGWWSVVWAYDRPGSCGRPFPLTLEALDAIKKTNRELGWMVPTDEDFEFFRIERDLPALQ